MNCNIIIHCLSIFFPSLPLHTNPLVTGYTDACIISPIIPDVRVPTALSTFSWLVLEKIENKFLPLHEMYVMKKRQSMVEFIMQWLWHHGWSYYY